MKHLLLQKIQLSIKIIGLAFYNVNTVFKLVDIDAVDTLQLRKVVFQAIRHSPASKSLVVLITNSVSKLCDSFSVEPTP